MKVNLPSGRYFLFADISPIKGIYVIEPVLLMVGEETESIANDFSKLVKSDRPTKEIQGKTVTFQHPKLTAGEPATLSLI
ncbi:hypothetical protein FK545_20180 (plasmid) [Planococcus glaciei]|nr:hypothetical protein [Planococcus glaciei]QDY46932.1 hypothetical protein FK545_20180 [Planococcus glaciei]